MDDMVVVYGRSGCGACVATRRRLTARGVDYTYRDVGRDPEAAAAATQLAETLGSRQLPLVTAPGKAWSGLNLEGIDSLGPPRVGDRTAPALSPTREHALGVGV